MSFGFRHNGSNGSNGAVHTLGGGAGRRFRPIENNDRYKWIALTNTTLGVFLITVDSSIMLIALPDIFKGIRLDPLLPGNSFYLLWMILSFLVTTSVLVVSLGRLGDIYGRVRMYNFGFAFYTFFSLLLTITWMSGTTAALYLVIMRVFQGVGAAFLWANSSAILTDAFPEHQRGMALGVNQVFGIAGMFIGLVLGGVLGPIQWRLIFLVSVPVGLFGTVWAYLKLREGPRVSNARVDWLGNLTFAVGLILLMVGITYGIQPYGTSSMGWMSPFVLSTISSGVALLVLFGFIEKRVPDPMFRLSLFKIRAYTAGSVATLLSAIGRGGLMFMLIIWLQGIWLPLHGYNAIRTPLWAGIYMLPLTAGFLLAGPISGILSDRFGSRPFATGGMLGAALSFFLLELLPVNFSYEVFAPLLLLNGLSMGAFAAPNRGRGDEQPPGGPPRGGLGNEHDLPERRPGALDRHLLHAHDHRAELDAVDQPVQRAHLPARPGRRSDPRRPPAAGLHAVRGVPGLQPDAAPFGGERAGPSAEGRRRPPSRPQLLPAPHLGRVSRGLHTAFDFAVIACLIAAGASWMRGGKFIYSEPALTPAADAVEEAPAVLQPAGVER